MASRDKILDEALALPERERLRLARELLESLEALLSPEDEAELLERIDEIDRGGRTTSSRALIASLTGDR